MNRPRMGRDGYVLCCRAVLLMTLIIAVSPQQQNRRTESITSCFLAEYALWRKLEQVVIFGRPSSGRIYFRYKSVDKVVPAPKYHTKPSNILNFDARCRWSLRFTLQPHSAGGSGRTTALVWTWWQNQLLPVLQPLRFPDNSFNLGQILNISESWDNGDRLTKTEPICV